MLDRRQAAPLLSLFLLFLLLLMLFLAPELGAQNLGSLEDIAGYALENNLEYRKALWEAVKAEDDVEGILKLDETSFFANGAWTDDQDGDRGDWNGTAGMEIPLIDQLSLKGSVNRDLSGSAGLTFSPLFHSDTRQQTGINWHNAVAYAEETGIRTENTALSSALNWMTAKKQLLLQERVIEVKETIYRDEKVRYGAGESTLDDVRDALLDWTEARTGLSDQQALLRQGESELLKALSGNLDTASISLIGTGDLETALEQLKDLVSPEAADPAGIYAVTAARLSSESTSEELKNTWLFSPDLSLEGAVNLPDVTDLSSQGSPSWEASLQLSFSLQDWQKEDREELKTDLSLSQEEAARAVMESRLSLQQTLITLDTTRQNREIAELELEQARDLLEEAEFLHRLGEYSEAERDDAQLTLNQSEVNLFSALAEEYIAWREVLVYLP